ncbi:MAG: hypothetical protein HY532_06090 [Chloroflexi bacterium]|nr:hypothetical protein [Chloroflexota bacterium]
MVFPALFVIGLGWNIAFVGATVVLSDATRPLERARLLGFNDLAATNTGALGAAISGIILGVAGLAPLILVGAFLALLPMLGVFPRRARAVPTVP